MVAPQSNRVLSDVEIAMLGIAKGYLEQSVTKQEAVDKLIERESDITKFALDKNQVQILQELDDHYVRFGLAWTINQGVVEITPLGSKTAFGDYDLAQVVPNSPKFKEVCTSGMCRLLPFWTRHVLATHKVF